MCEKKYKNFLLIAEVPENSTIDDFIYSIKPSIYYNMYQFFHGKKYIDVFWYRVKSDTNQRVLKFRKTPTDFFDGEFYIRNKLLSNKQIFWPIFERKKLKIILKKRLLFLVDLITGIS